MDNSRIRTFRIQTDGMQIETRRFEQNPAVLYNHDHRSTIGRAVKVDTSDGLKIDIEMAKNQFADDLLAIIDDPKNQSPKFSLEIRFIALEKEDNVIKKAELMEVSLAPKH